MKQARQGKIMVSFAVMLPVIIAILGLTFDGGLLMHDRRHTQNVADSAASAAAMDLINGRSIAVASSTAEMCVQMANGFADAEVTVNIPPESGPYIGRADYVEVIVDRRFRSRIMQVISDIALIDYSARSSAAAKPSTSGAVVHILDTDPDAISIVALPPLLPAPYAVFAGLEVEGVGQLRVDGAVLVNTQWGGVDENGNQVGSHHDLSRGAACTPLLPLTQLAARDIRIAGGVDTPHNYCHFTSGEPSPLFANRLAVPDPLVDLPTPTTASDPANVSAVDHGGVTVLALPLVALPTTLQPGVYDWIQVLSGNVIFEPGIYIIRGKHPLTNISLNLLGGSVQAEGVMFYISDDSAFDVATGTPDSTDGDTTPPTPQLGALFPSILIADTLIDSTFSPLDDADSPFDGMMLYQRRHDRRPIVITQQCLLLGGHFAGRVYAKWGHLTLVSGGEYDATFAVGTMRVVTVFDTLMAPTNPLPPANDAFVVE